MRPREPPKSLQVLAGSDNPGMDRAARGARSTALPGLHDQSGRPLAGRRIRLAGVSTHVFDVGQGPPVLLLHGYGDTADGWRHIVPELLREHRVIAVDLPPFGRSGTPRGPALIDFYRDFFPQLYRRLELERATIVGHSLGGAMALQMALEEPGMVERLALVAPAGLGSSPPWWWHLTAGRWLPWQLLLSIPSPVTTPAIRRGMSFFLDWRLFHHSRGMASEAGRLLDLHANRRSLASLLRAGRLLIDGYTGTLLEQASEELRVPVLMVWGRYDGLAPVEHARAFERAVPQARVHVLQSCGHYPQIEHYERFTELLLGFLADTARSRQRRGRVA